MKNKSLAKLIDNLTYVSEPPRDYIGASSIGSECWRQIWYEFNEFEGLEVPNKTKRTWEVGKNLEILVIEWLEATGLNITNTWIDLRDDELPYFRGHVDALLMNKDNQPKEIIEIKTAKDGSFNQFVKNGLKKWQPKYYAQIQSYMGMSGIHSASILVLNKDNSDLFDEKVPFSPEFYESLKNKAKAIHDSKTEPPRISGNPLWFTCKTCRFRKECHS